MGSRNPLLNDYKQALLQKRFPQTILGGIHLKLGQKTPCSVYVVQLLLLLFPWWCVGSVFTAAVVYDLISLEVALCAYGATITVCAILIRGIATVVQSVGSSRHPHVEQTEQVRTFSEEDEVEFDSCCGRQTLAFILPRKRYHLNIVFHGLTSGVMCGLGLWYLLPSSLYALFGENTTVMILLFIFGWLTLCIAQYSLTAAPPPEPATYTTTDNYELCALSRPLHVILFCLLHLAARCVR